MRVILIPSVMLLCAASLLAQSMPPGLQSNTPPAAMPTRQMGTQQPPPVIRPSTTGVDVPPDTAVVTLAGVCDQPRVPATKACKTVITRQQIDSLMDVLTPGASPAARRAFAVNYARMLAASAAAERKNLEKDPAVSAELQAELKLARLRVLSNSFYHRLGETADDVPDSEIQKYYAEHKVNFEAGLVRRLTVPKVILAKNTVPLDPSAVKANTEELYSRASKGEDFDQVQREAYLMFGIATLPPPTKAILLRRPSMRPTEAVVFDLNVGEVTPMLDSPDAYVILKLESKQPISIELAQPEIKPVLQRERKAKGLEDATKNVSADFNLAYLGVPSAPELFVPPTTGQPSDSRVVDSPMRSRAPVRSRMPLAGGAPRGFPPPPRQ